MSHRYKSTCCCEDNPEVVGTCFTGFGAVPKTPYAPVNTGCSDDNIPNSDFNRFDNWELCGHDNEEEILFKIDRGSWKSVTTAFHSGDICTGACNCPPHEVGYGGLGETPIYTWYASHTSTKIQDEPGVRLSDVMQDDQVYTWYHTTDFAQRVPPYSDGFTDIGELGGLNKWTLPLNPNPRDLGGQLEDYFPPGTEMPCGCGEYANFAGACLDVLCRQSYFQYCKNDPYLAEPFGSVYSTSTPITRGQYQLIGGTTTNLRWRTSEYGWLRGGDYAVNDPCLIKYTEHGGNYFWLQDIVERSRFATTDKYYPHWEASYFNGLYAVKQRFSYGQCGGNDGSEAPYFGWPLGRTLIAVFHKEKWWQRYWSSIDENDVCPDDDPNCGTCPRDADGNCPPDWSSTDLDIYPGHFASCRTPRFIGQSCAGIPVFSHEIMTNARLKAAATPTNEFGINAGNGAEYIILACAFDWPIPKYLTDIMEEDGILPDPNPNLTEIDGEDVAYRIFKKPLRHFNGTSDGATLGRCCVNLEGFNYGTYPDNPGPLRPKGDCGTESRFRVFDIYEDYDPLGATCGCTDPECVSWAKPTWDEELAGFPKEEASQDELENIENYSCFGGIRTGEECFCMDCESAELFGVTGPEGSWNEDCIADIYFFGGTHCFPQTLCIPNIPEFECKVGYIGTWQAATENGAGCTLTDPDGRDFKSCDQLRNEELIGSCCFKEAGGLGGGGGPGGEEDEFGPPSVHCLVTTKGVCEDMVDELGFIKEKYLPSLVERDDDANPFCSIIAKNPNYEGPACVRTTDPTECSASDDGEEECSGLVSDNCDGILSLQCFALKGAPGTPGLGALDQPVWSPLRQCEPVEAVNDGFGPYTGFETDTGKLNDCTFQCRAPRVPDMSPPTDDAGNFRTCFDELEIAVDDKGNEAGDVCGVGYTTEFEYFYGRPGGWSWICNRQLNPVTESQFPQVTRNGSGCALPSGAEDTTGTCVGNDTYACRTSVGGGPGCFSAGPYPQETYSGPIRSCCCRCPNDGLNPLSNFQDPGGLPCDDTNNCTCINPCVTCYCGPAGLCVVEPIPCEELSDEAQDQCGCNGCDNACTQSNGTQCACDDCQLRGNWEEGCEGDEVPCPPPLASICGSGCNDLGQDVDGCQVSDSGVGAIGTESMDFCSYANRSNTCDGSWIQQQGTSLSTGQDDGRPFGYDCSYVNNAFILRVNCPDKDPDRDGPGCKEYCAEYDIAWNTILVDEEDPDSEVSYPIVNGVTFDGDPTSGIQELEFYEDCVHNVYQRDITNAADDFAKCFILELEQEDGTYAIADPDNVGLRCPDGNACTDGVGNGCGCSDGSCDLIFGRDMVTEVVVNDPPSGFELKRQRGRLIFSTGPGNNINPIPVKIIWNAKKNPHTNLDGLIDYEWYHVPMKRHKENPSGAFVRQNNPDCCKCCGSQLSINGGAGIMCERRKKSVSGEGCGGGRYCEKCLYKRKPSQGEGLPDPACGVDCGEGFYCCPLTGQCIPINGLPGADGEIIGCEDCLDICEEGFVCCTSAIPDTDPVEYSTRCINEDLCENFGPSSRPGEDDDDTGDDNPPGAFNINIIDNPCVPNCEFTVNTPITIIAEEA